MTTEQEERTRLAAEILGCKRKEVQERVRAMAPAQRVELSDHIDDVLAWATDYEAAEALANYPRGRA